jgi:hypothetical protein
LLIGGIFKLPMDLLRNQKSEIRNQGTGIQHSKSLFSAFSSAPSPSPRFASSKTLDSHHPRSASLGVLGDLAVHIHSIRATLFMQQSLV